ncbi:phosphoribosylaminoimidazolesuccinocarboxamide synthase [Virgibacillus soli]|uniref:phosphoribosylaminoimidazolesuccinocarboxamide synthase n=1 Tax=Paracerasibacillus soli TaxID=480284 RepID=A0ABU5CW56_9BACI|nr:phosphoribosylaminoimidazolesuccinocarboxamide synthase [Virgibacillus soli]MDY0409628.1 phosphoribosylaminoimidazolesuccinocarboxamide synthase [Virgibacillus soli]
MKRIYTGKTKDVYACEDGNYILKFKDDMTGEDGVFDPGSNTVGLQIEGAGKAGLRLTTYFFELLKKNNIPTHYLSANMDEAKMKVVPATSFGDGLEVICRYRAVGSFMRRYGKYASEGQTLDGFVEVTIKDDERGDPPISKEALEMLHIITPSEYDQMVVLTKEISAIVKAELARKDITLYDIKLEFGKNQAGDIILIDEISGGNMRAFKGGQAVSPLELTELIVEKV